MSRTVAATTTGRVTQAEAQAFLNREAALLDDGRHEEWLALFAHDGVFWVPSNEADYNPAQRVSIVYEDRVKLADRVARLGLGRAVQENPSRTMHVISNVTVSDRPGSDAPPKPWRSWQTLCCSRCTARAAPNMLRAAATCCGARMITGGSFCASSCSSTTTSTRRTLPSSSDGADPGLGAGAVAAAE